MASSIDALGIRRRLGRDLWSVPVEFGPDGWTYDAREPHEGRVIVTCADHDGDEWVHASMSHPDLYQVFVPGDEHVNIHEHTLHLFGRLDGERVLPDFTYGMGSI